MNNDGLHEFLRNALPIALCRLDTDGFIHDVNRRFTELICDERQDLIEKNLRQLVVPEDCSLFMDWLQQLAAGHYPWCEIRLQRSDEFLIPVQLRATLDPAASGSAPMYYLTLIELATLPRETAQKADLEFQAALLDSIGEAVIATDLLGQILYWNRAAELIYGWRAEEVLGKNIIDVTPVQENKELGLEIMAALQSGQAWTGEFNVRHRDGHDFPAHVTDTCLRDSTGQLSVIIGVSSDITEKKAWSDKGKRWNRSCTNKNWRWPQRKKNIWRRPVASRPSSLRI